MKKTQKIKDILTIVDDMFFSKEECQRLISELEALHPTLPAYEIPQMTDTMDMLNNLSITK